MLSNLHAVLFCGLGVTHGIWLPFMLTQTNRQEADTGTPYIDVSRPVSVPLKWFPEPADWDKMPFMLTGAHYKCGSELFQQLNQAISVALAQHDPEGKATPYYQPSGYGRYSGIDDEPILFNFAYPAEWAYANLTSRPFRFFHSIRDPIELTISAYWYLRRKQYDLCWGPCQIITQAELAQLLSSDTLTGLEITARGVLNHTVEEMRTFLKASQGDPRVITIGLENSESDFNRTVSCMHRFLMEPTMPQVYKSLANSLLEGSQRADAGSKKATVLSTNEVHFNSDDNKVMSRNLIAASTNPVWDELREARRELGYQATEDGRFMLPWPSQC